MANHTPTPWTTGGDGADIFGPGTAPTFSDSKHIADCQTDSPGLLGMRSVDAANARFIVRAVNCHDDLLAALEEAMKELWDERHSHMTEKAFRQEYLNQFTAIEKAKGAA